ncbi:MAG: small subunit ribosomal protein [Patescibacteria group bacterium]|nr:small subunit ribosomal protein [Patescibacteria group bacterium]
MSNMNTSELMKVGAHYGYTRTRRHPSAKPFVKSSTNGVDFIDLEKTEAQIDEAVKFLKTVLDANKQVVFVGSKPEMKQIVKEISLAVGQPYIADRYIGGTFTNYPQIRKRIEKLHDLLKKKENGELSVYTKKEQLLIQKDIERLDRNFGGLTNLEGLPGALIIVDSKKESMCVDEAIRMNIPVVALCNTDCDNKVIDYPIVINEAAPQVVRALLESIKTIFNK